MQFFLIEAYFSFIEMRDKHKEKERKPTTTYDGEWNVDSLVIDSYPTVHYYCHINLFY